MNEVIYKIRVNRPCRLFIDDEEMMILDENRLTKISLPEGEYLRKVVAIDNKAIYDEAEITLSGSSELDTITLDTTGLEEAKRNALPRDEFQVGDLMYKALEDGNGVAVAEYVDKNVMEVVIPEEIVYGHYIYEVKEIGNWAFHSCSNLTSITIPNSVTEIGYEAFTNCHSLTSITIPNSVTSIGGGAFSGCTGLTSIIVEQGNTVYDSRENCNAIIETATNTLISGCQNTTIPNSVTSIGSAAFEGTAFYNNPSNWDKGALYLGDCLIRLADGYVRDYKIKVNTRLIACGAFAGCSNLTSITIPNSVTSIGNQAFAGCRSLSSVTIGNSVTSIGEWAFAGCSGLTSITIQNSVKSIGDYAFNLCQGLTSVTIGNSVTRIGRGAFENCSGLTSITIPNSVTSIGREAFLGCKGLTSITIPNSVKSIGDKAFWYCTGLTSVTIGNSVKSIGDKAFIGCSSLTSITIPNSVTWIGEGAFENCSGLTSITIPNSVTSIECRAFDGCSSLTSITIPNSVTEIGFGVFLGCSSLTSVTIPNSVTRIGSAAFKGTAFYNNPSNWDKRVLYIDNCLITANINITGYYNIKESTRLIADWAFDGCSSLTSITIPNSVTEIGFGAFRGCSSLTSVTVPSHTTIAGNAFPKHTQIIRK